MVADSRKKVMIHRRRREIITASWRTGKRIRRDDRFEDLHDAVAILQELAGSMNAEYFSTGQTLFRGRCRGRDGRTRRLSSRHRSYRTVRSLIPMFWNVIVSGDSLQLVYGRDFMFDQRDYEEVQLADNLCRPVANANTRGV
jgi:hypothetical protein